ncbi:hypothetical protein CJ030_MR6G027696 [Morella rubra]|uniref:Uncharacterized protein n=1 Tax=Morella rubra TaxID=262757 RepID=A0A6A1VCB0_9ROSI|nr:hypothetical protein CJ030_MR6G027696 [Morella rubra]
MGYRKKSRSNWVPKNQDTDDEDEDKDMEVPNDIHDEDANVAEVEDEPEGKEVDAEAMEFDVDANLVDDPPVIPSPTRVPDPPTSLSARFTSFEERITTMHEVQRKFLEDRVTYMKDEQRKFFEEMRHFMTTRFPPLP